MTVGQAYADALVMAMREGKPRDECRWFATDEVERLRSMLGMCGTGEAAGSIPATAQCETPPREP